METTASMNYRQVLRQMIYQGIQERKKVRPTAWVLEIALDAKNALATVDPPTNEETMWRVLNENLERYGRLVMGACCRADKENHKRELDAVWGVMKSIEEYGVSMSKKTKGGKP